MTIPAAPEPPAPLANPTAAPPPPPPPPYRPPSPPMPPTAVTLEDPPPPPPPHNGLNRGATKPLPLAPADMAIGVASGGLEPEPFDTAPAAVTPPPAPPPVAAAEGAPGVPTPKVADAEPPALDANMPLGRANEPPSPPVASLVPPAPPTPPLEMTHEPKVEVPPVTPEPPFDPTVALGDPAPAAPTVTLSVAPSNAALNVIMLRHPPIPPPPPPAGVPAALARPLPPPPPAPMHTTSTDFASACLVHVPEDANTSVIDWPAAPMPVGVIASMPPSACEALCGDGRMYSS